MDRDIKKIILHYVFRFIHFLILIIFILMIYISSEYIKNSFIQSIIIILSVLIMILISVSYFHTWNKIEAKIDKDLKKSNHELQQEKIDNKIGFYFLPFVITGYLLGKFSSSFKDIGNFIIFVSAVLLIIIGLKRKRLPLFPITFRGDEVKIYVTIIFALSGIVIGVLYLIE
ncbi:MAG: hypothetical protein CVV49_22005 [Spirochaetae bacterium HGW-Spirochaetae-5]|nr:MAG: hypothetical protein CVV49_22005 [Spirochaetae bacterium HGW-Spirochaetae-5]